MGTEAMMTEETGEKQKIRTDFARITVSGSPADPYYGILYYDLGDGKWHEGFGSYSLRMVHQWLREEFEIEE